MQCTCANYSDNKTVRLCLVWIFLFLNMITQGFQNGKKVSGGNWKIAGAGEGAGGGFPLLQGGFSGGLPQKKIENLHALRCILVHFQDQKVIF